MGFPGAFCLMLLWPGKALSGSAAPLASATWTGRGLPSAVGLRTLVGPLYQNPPFGRSWLRLPVAPRGGRYLCALLRLRLLNPRWPHGLSLPFGWFLPRQQAFGPAFAPDLVVLLGSSLRYQDVRSCCHS
ncbi:hypothetical protein PanWU01x14_272830 [Parasponia andersonii]|uniref:Secreted protein n=1 Tax=Parasponia andersonii TaxID=3476 RepID=A0A2P5B458_PARAD|nr:hypothetical protein PanWU01x14_272830 [Parasponia andersonii]